MSRAYPKPGVFQRTKRRITWESASLCLKRLVFRWLSSGAGRFMTDLTWMLGWTNISTEGGPERRLYVP